MTILDQIVAHKRAEVAQARQARPPAELQRTAQARSPAPDFAGALRSAPMGLIAEVKRRSPSAGPIRDPFDARSIAQGYEAAGAQAISVLLDAEFFGGGEADFQAVREAVCLPLLYKEFVVDEWQVWHAAALGASAVLLIAAVLGDEDLKRMVGLCREAGLQSLLEVHDEADLRRAAGLGADCIGVNNRDLRTFKVSIETTLRLRPLAPAGCLLISESGIHSAGDVTTLQSAGVGAVLVGEHLLRQPDVSAAVRDLMGSAWGRGVPFQV